MYDSKSEAINLLENSVLDDCGYIYKKYCQFSLLLLFGIYKMVDIMGFCKYLNIPTVTVIKIQKC